MLIRESAKEPGVSIATIPIKDVSYLNHRTWRPPPQKTTTNHHDFSSNPIQPTSLLRPFSYLILIQPLLPRFLFNPNILHHHPLYNNLRLLISLLFFLRKIMWVLILSCLSQIRELGMSCNSYPSYFFFRMGNYA